MHQTQSAKMLSTFILLTSLCLVIASTAQSLERGWNFENRGKRSSKEAFSSHWKPFPGLNIPRNSFQTVTLQGIQNQLFERFRNYSNDFCYMFFKDGTILAIGGSNASGTLASVETYDASSKVLFSMFKQIAKHHSGPFMWLPSLLGMEFRRLSKHAHRT